MEIIPVIHIKKRKIVTSGNKDFDNVKNLLKKYENNFIYLLDHDGVSKNKPNLCLFQKLSRNHDLWVDTGPRVIGDIVDSVVAGASKITIRENLIDKTDSLTINEILENEIYIKISSNLESISENIIPTWVYGLVFFIDEMNFKLDFKNQSYFKRMVEKKVAYLYLSNINNLKHINKFDIKGILVDIEKIKEFENNWNTNQRK